MLTADYVAATLAQNNFNDTEFTCPDGARAVVSPCYYGKISRAEDCEYFLVYWDIPWGGTDDFAALVDMLNNHAVFADEQQDGKRRLYDFFVKHQRDGWTADDFDWFSDWHKDVFGYRPRGGAFGEDFQNMPE